MFNVKEEREKVGMSQSELAQSIGITNVYLSDVERGKKNMSRPLMILAKKIINEKAKKLILDEKVANGGLNSNLNSSLDNLCDCDNANICPSCGDVIMPGEEREIKQCVRSNNLMLNNIVQRMQLFAKGLDAIQSVESEVSRRVKSIVDAQTDDLKRDFREHINRHVYVILSTLSAFATVIQCIDLRDANQKEQLLQMLTDIQQYVRNMQV